MKVASRTKKVLDSLREDSGVCVKCISVRTGVSMSHTYGCLKQLVNSGAVERMPKGTPCGRPSCNSMMWAKVYRLTERGAILRKHLTRR